MVLEEQIEKTVASRIKTYIADVTLTTAAQTNITSLGTLTALQVDNININGNAISSTAGTDLTITPVPLLKQAVQGF